MNFHPKRYLALPLATLLLTACGQAPSSRQIESVGLRMVSPTDWQGEDQYARLEYPLVAGPQAQRLNPVIERWIGARCPVPGPGKESFPDAAGCVAAFAKACATLRKAYSQGQVFGCTLDGDAEIEVDAAGLLGLKYTTYTFAGGAHGNTVVSYLNLDLGSGHVLGLDDLLDHPDKIVLARRIEQAMRAQRHIPDGESLKKAGFFVDHLTPVDTVLALPEGLLFTYQSYAVGPYVLGQPHALVPYAALGGMVRKDGPLPRLHALLEGG